MGGLWLLVLAFVLGSVGGPRPAGAQQLDACAGRSPQFLALTVVGTISPRRAPDGTMTTTPLRVGFGQFVDMCERSEFGLAAPFEAHPSSRCVQQFGSEARTEILAMRSVDGRAGFYSTCVAETVAAICEALSDCAVPLDR